MLLVWQHANKDPEHHGRQPMPVLARTDNPLAILRALGDNVGWRGRYLFLHPDAEDPRPEGALAVIGWAKFRGEWHWVADGPGTYGFLRDTVFEWIERGMDWTAEQKASADSEISRRGWERG